MRAEKSTWKTKNSQSTLGSEKFPKKFGDSDVVITEKNDKTPESDVSIFTKTTRPNVILESESLKGCWSTLLQKHCCGYRMLKFLCFIILCIIVLMTFFLALKTYNLVNELANYVLI